MLAAIRSAALCGVAGTPVMVEVDAARGLPYWVIVGLAANAVKESRERVSAAISNAGFEMPSRRFTVSLAPGDTRKDGTAFDLPIALGVLVATGQLRASAVEGIAALGELGLDGSVRPVRGMLPIAMHVARDRTVRALLGPVANGHEAALVPNLRYWAASRLREVVQALEQGERECTRVLVTPPAELHQQASRAPVDLIDVAGQETAKRALTIAAAGGHALLMVGAPGSGKTMLARRLPTILPALSDEESLEVMTVRSVAGLLRETSQGEVERPFRAPHHSLSTAALVGGGSIPRPGEITLAHHGVLFLDELQEMPRSRLDVLRQPMEEGRVLIARAQQSVVFPAAFALVGAMNPCPCGYAGDGSARCRCSAPDVARHRGRVSGPLADRIDLCVQVPPLALGALAQRSGETSLDVRRRVEAARELQRRRYASQLPGVSCNARATGRWLDAHSPIDSTARSTLVRAAERIGLSARGFHRILSVARTIADLAGDCSIGSAHVAEAFYFRTADALPPPEVAA